MKMMELATTTPLHRDAQTMFRSAPLLGVTTFAVTSAERLVELVGRSPGILVAMNAEKLATGDPRIVAIANANLAYPDGMGAVLALKRNGLNARRVAGADLWLDLVARYASTKRFYLVGGTSEVIEETARRLRASYPDLRLQYRSGYFSADETGQMIENVRTTRSDIVLVATGSPQQELLMADLYAAHPAAYVGLGGSFDVFVGKKPRAPRWIRSAGLEWAYQFARNPSRLHRLPAYLKFAILLAAGRVR
ncbi:MAG: WecB/TagA/CpsF family glycosyltransferase [Erythrobacter sp.]|nr:WecB/TagA/CpsF family glycosyltransferase [Erythrobacter sp.]